VAACNVRAEALTYLEATATADSSAALRNDNQKNKRRFPSGMTNLKVNGMLGGRYSMMRATTS
jgi:hypothetical protein